MSERADPRAQFNNLPWKDKIGNFFMRKCGLFLWQIGWFFKPQMHSHTILKNSEKEFDHSESVGY